MAWLPRSWDRLLWGSLALLVCCGSPPTKSEPQHSLAGHTLYVVVQSDTVTWTLSDTSYQFQQINPAIGRVAWERGTWWEGVDFDGNPALVFSRAFGASRLLRPDGSLGWNELPPLTRPYTMVRLGDWLGLKTTTGAPIYYEVR